MTNNNNGGNGSGNPFGDDLGNTAPLEARIANLLERGGYFSSVEQMDKFARAGSVSQYAENLSPSEVRKLIAAVEKIASQEQSKRALVMGTKAERNEDPEAFKRLQDVERAHFQELAGVLREMRKEMAAGINQRAANTTNVREREILSQAQASMFRFGNYADNLEFGGRQEFYDLNINQHREQVREARAKLATKDPNFDIRNKDVRARVREANAASRQAIEDNLKEVLANDEMRRENPGMYHQRLSANMAMLSELSTSDKLFTQSIDPAFTEKARMFKESTRDFSINKALGRNIDRGNVKSNIAELKKLSEDLQRTDSPYTFENSEGGEDRAARQQALQQVVNLINTNKNLLENQTSKFEKIFGSVMSVMSALGIRSYASKLMMSDPYQYTFQPAMSMLGNMGGMGSILGSALSAQGSYDYELNSQMFNGGANMLMGAPLMKSLFKGRAGLMGALGLGIAGVTGTVLGATGHGDDLFKGIASLTGKKDASQIAFESSLGQSMMNPQALIQRYQNTLPSVTGWGLDNVEGGGLGFLTGDKAKLGGRGNTVLNSIYGSSYNGISLAKLLNPTGDEINGTMQSMGRATGRNGATGLGDLTTTAMIKGMLNGTSAETFANQYGIARGFGSKNLRGDADVAAAAVYDPNVNKTFAAEVLVPALMKVTSSITLRNIAANGSEMNKMVANYYRAITSSGSNFGNLVKQSPELLDRLFSTLEGSMRSAETNPAVMQGYLRYGIQPYQVANGISDANTVKQLLSGIGSDLVRGGLSSGQYDPSTGRVNSNYAAGMLQNIGGRLNIDAKTMREVIGPAVMAMLSNGGQLAPGAIEEIIKKLQAREKEDAKKITGDDLNTVANNFKESTEGATNMMSKFTERILELQSWLQKYITSPQFQASAATGLQTLLDQLKLTLGIKSKSELPANQTQQQADEAQTSARVGASTAPGGAASIDARKQFTSQVTSKGNPLVDFINNTDLDNTMRSLLGMSASSDEVKNKAVTLGNAMSPDMKKELTAAIKAKDGKRVQQILQGWGGGLMKSGSVAHAALSQSGAFKNRWHPLTVSQTDVLQTGQDVLNLMDKSSDFATSMGEFNASSTANAGGDLNARTNLYNARGNNVTSGLSKKYNSQLYSTLKSFTGSGKASDIAKEFMDAAGVKEVANFNDGHYLDKQIKIFKEKVDKLPEGSSERFKAERTLQSLMSIKNTQASVLRNSNLTDARKHNYNLETNRMAYMSMLLGNGNIDPYGTYSDKKGNIRGGIGGISQVSKDEFKQNYSIGGYTGAGNKHEVAGTVHKGEYVIPSERIAGNEKTINALLAGQKMDGGRGTEDSLTSDGENVRLVMDVSGYSVNQLRNIVQSEIISFAKDTKVLYK